MNVESWTGMVVAVGLAIAGGTVAYNDYQAEQAALDTVGSCVYSIKETMIKKSPELKVAYVGHTALDTPQTLDTLHSIDMMIQFKGMNQTLELFCAGKAGEYSWAHDKAQAIGRVL